MSKQHYRWAAPGDVNAFFGLMLDNVADMLLTVGLLFLVFDFPTEFALQHMVPGTAIGVLVGDLLFFWIAIRTARKLGRDDVTAMPLGLDTPSTFGMVFFVLGPAFLHAKKALTDGGLGLSIEEAARYAWHIGICSIVISGIFKLGFSLSSNWVRRVVPRAGLLGSLTAIALVLISFLPFIEVLQHPVVGFTSMAIILTALVAKLKLPFRIPGALGAMLVAGVIYYLMHATGTLGEVQPAEFNPREALLPTGWLSVFRFQWLEVMGDAFHYLPIVIPFALATVVGGIDCTESAAAAGDEFDTNQIVGVEAVATLIAGLCGGVIQSTPYIGHPAYKAMGGRAAYTLATALFIGSAGILGYFGYLYFLIPKATIFPILIFIGLEITAQSFVATKQKHYPAVVIACIPALAALVVVYIDKIFGDAALWSNGITIASLGASLQAEIQITRVLSAGFIMTSMIWSSALAFIIDRRLRIAAAFFLVAALFSLFGVIHSPLAGSPICLPWAQELVKANATDVPLRFAVAYLVISALLMGWSLLPQNDQEATEA